MSVDNRTAGDDLSSEAPVELARVTFRLETDMSDFESWATEFYKELAGFLEVDPEELRVVDIRSGCVLVTFEMSAEEAAFLLQAVESGDSPDALRALKQKRKVTRIWDVDKLEAAYAYVNSASTSDESERSLTWLHLSDLHLGTGDGAARFDQDQVTSNFLDRISSLLKESQIKPDMVLFTGDVAYSGEKDQYEAAGEFFKEMANRLEEPARFFFVPGNHDISWNEITPDDDLQVRESLVDEDSVLRFLLDPSKEGQRKKQFSRQNNYRDFERLHRPQVDEFQDFGYFYCSMFEHEGIKVGVAGLNSAWCSTSKRLAPDHPYVNDPDYSHMHLGDHQLSTASNRLQDCELRFALVHHPPLTDWFSDHDNELQDDYWSKFDFVLRGHLHRPAHIGVNDLDHEDNWYHFASGALSTGLKKNPKKFTGAKLDLDTGEGQLFYWGYYRRDPGWQLDYFRAVRKPLTFTLYSDARRRLLEGKLAGVGSKE